MVETPNDYTSHFYEIYIDKHEGNLGKHMAGYHVRSLNAFDQYAVSSARPYCAGCMPMTGWYENTIKSCYEINISSNSLFE